LLSKKSSFFSLKAGAKLLTFFDMAKLFFCKGMRVES
jgi:hypothetical protein